MRELLEKFGTQSLRYEDLILLENKDLITWYDGWHITTLGWLLLLKDRAPVEEIRMLLLASEQEYQDLLADLKEKSL